MTKPPTPPKPDLTDYEEEAVPFNEVLRRLLGEKPTPEPEKPTKPRKSGEE